MKWTIILTALGGLAAFALIFLAQSGQDRPQSAVAADLAVEHDEVAPATAVDFAQATRGETASSSDTEPIVANSTDVEPDSPPLFTGDPWQAGVRAFNDGDFELAEMALVAAVNRRPEVSYRHYLLGLTYLQRDEPASAVEEFEASLELSPGNVRTLVNLARAQLELDETDAARAAVDEALGVDVDDADAWNVLGRVELASGLLEEAQQAFRNATVRNPLQAFAWNNLGYSLILAEQFGDAVSPLQQAVSLRDDVAYFFNNLGIALERAEYLPQAAAAFSRAAGLGHELASISKERVGLILIARGEAAASTWEVVLDSGEPQDFETTPEEEEMSALVDW